MRIAPFRANLGAGAGLALIFSVAEEAAALLDFLVASAGGGLSVLGVRGFLSLGAAPSLFVLAAVFAVSLAGSGCSALVSSAVSVVVVSTSVAAGFGSAGTSATTEGGSTMGILTGGGG